VKEPSSNAPTKKHRGDVYIVCRLLMIRDDKRVYNLREKSFAKILATYLKRSDCSAKAIMEDFEKGDMGKTAQDVRFFSFFFSFFFFSPQ
jgi:hypothetical protein